METTTESPSRMTSSPRSTFVAHLGAILVMAAMVAFAVGPAAAEPELRDARIGLNGDKTRFVLEFDGAVPYQLFTLNDPDRVVIDLPAVDWKGPRPEEIASRGLVAKFRYGLYRPGIARVVLDLSGPASIARHFILAADGSLGQRLVVDLEPARQTARLSAPITSSGWQEYSDRLARSSPATRSLGPPPNSTKRVVVLDPGHGGVDPGAIGTSGVYEKNIVLGYAKILKETLEATGRYDVVLTRDRDIFIPLRDRYGVAHRVNAGLFISIHADSHASSNIRGLSVYTLSDKASDREAAALAAQENKSDLLAGTDLTGYESDVTSILISLAQQSVMQSGSVFAQLLVEELRQEVRLLRNPHRFAGFAVLKSPNVPSVLVELGYLSMPSEERLLKSDAHQRKIAAGMVDAIDRFFEDRERLERS
jgi:N-acetylmuramoyl-L-alanine amidase